MRHLSIALLLTLAALPAAAGDAPLTYDRISLSASAEREIGNDTLVVVLRAMAEGEDPARLAEDVNDRVRWAVDQAKAAGGVEVQTSGYQTHPVYRQQQLVAWRVSHGVRLESRDSTALSELLAELQQRLSLVSMDYHVSAAARREAEGALMGEALELFRERAQRVTEQLQRPGYRLVQLDINTSSEGQRPPMLRAMAMESARADSAPVIEAGKQRVQVSVHGTIELKLQ